jgi:cobalamin biosynthesis protein CobT
MQKMESEDSESDSVASDDSSESETSSSGSLSSSEKEDSSEEEDEASSGESEDGDSSEESEESDSQPPPPPKKEAVGWGSVPTVQRFDQVKRGDVEGRAVMEKLVQEYLDLARKVSKSKATLQPQHWRGASDYRCFADQTDDKLLHIFLRREDDHVDRIVVSPASAAGAVMAMLNVAVFANPKAAIYSKPAKEVQAAFERTLKQLKQVSFSIKE